jgi:hypothetical protein
MAEVFLLLEREPETDWAGWFRSSPLYERYVGAGLACPQAPPSAPGFGPRQQSASTQFGVLCHRLLAVIAADRFFALSLLVLPLLLSLLAHAVPGRTDPSGLRSLLLVLIFGGAFLGSASSVRELVKERAIYRRERAIGLSLGAYLGSKLAVLGVITAGEGVVFAVLGMLGRGGVDDAVLLSSGRAEIAVAVVMVTLASMVIGLVISACIRNADRGMPLLVIVVMVQLILSGAVVSVSDRAGLEQLSWLVPAQWAFAMGASTMSLPQPGNAPSNALWRHEVVMWLGDAVVLGVLTVVLVVLVGLVVRRGDRQRARV